jgi:hypothetical protein
MMAQRRPFEREVPPLQCEKQGRMAGDNALRRTVRASRTVQPGNKIERQIRIPIVIPPHDSSANLPAVK